MSVVVAILGAGESRRMGQPKLCLPWVGGRTILRHEVEMWVATGVEAVLVVRPVEETSAVAREAASLSTSMPAGAAPLIALPTVAPEFGMMGSVLTAARWMIGPGAASLPPADVTHLVISLGDQPHLRATTLALVAAACAEHPGAIIRPQHEGRGGHPVAIPTALLPSLATTEAPHLKAFLEQYGPLTRAVPSDDPGLLGDIDTPEDYRIALAAAESPAKPEGPPPSPDALEAFMQVEDPPASHSRLNVGLLWIALGVAIIIGLFWGMRAVERQYEERLKLGSPRAL